MKIGEVSSKYNISKDNIYYYINYGLIVPPRPKGQYNFDPRTLKDLELILQLKELNFSLKEIHQVLSLHRISNLADKQDLEDLKDIYSKKKYFFSREKELLEQKIQSLDKEISGLNQKLSPLPSQTGVPISMLSLLNCPHCDCTLSISNANMDLRYIFNGKLSCDCGYCASITDGILITPNKNTSSYDVPDLTRELYRDLPPALISLFQRSYNWMVEKIKTMDLAHKVVMESYINAWFFMHNHLKYLSPQGRYIVVDKFPETLTMYKELIDKQNFGLDILYIADSSMNLPLKHNCVDLHIDYFASNEHNFFCNTFLLEELKPFFTENSLVLGTYFYFENGYKSMKHLVKEYPESSANNFNKKFFINQLAKNNYHLIDSTNVGYSTSSGTNLGFSFHVEGEKMHLMPYLAKK